MTKRKKNAKKKQLTNTNPLRNLEFIPLALNSLRSERKANAKIKVDVAIALSDGPQAARTTVSLEPGRRRRHCPYESAYSINTHK